MENKQEQYPIYEKNQFPIWLKLIIVIAVLVIVGVLAWVISSYVSEPKPVKDAEELRRQEVLNQLREPASFALTEADRQQIREELKKDSDFDLTEEQKNKILQDLTK